MVKIVKKRKILLFMILIYLLYLNVDFSQLIEYHESQIDINKPNSLVIITNLTKKLNNKNENFDTQSYCSSMTNNWRWKPLFIIYNSLVDQHEFFDSQSNELINELDKINKTITLEKIKNFKIEYNQRIEYFF